jgi:hypothetical protein
MLYDQLHCRAASYVRVYREEIINDLIISPDLGQLGVVWWAWWLSALSNRFIDITHNGMSFLSKKMIIPKENRRQ